MCVSTGPADFSGTTLYVGRHRHPERGLVHVLGYQNTAVNRADGPNAMLLHLPATAMTRDNFLDVGRDTDVLERMVRAVRPRSRGAGGAAVMDWMGAEESVQVFEHDVYTVLLATDPTALPSALERVPARKRPALDPALMRFYAERYPGYAMAVCCFDNAEAARAKPLLLWYRPLDADVLTAPALDAHTGRPPGMVGKVPVDHWVLFGSDEAPRVWGAPVSYNLDLRHRLRAFLPTRVVGAHFSGLLPNGDFAVHHDDLLSSGMTHVRRVPQMSS
ncbi:hypothetical protein MMF93_22495 [Streptomyces tubbatahanensis]|uniref:Uncharacterized protein n=1 Tax=Streptomyces tubbatahanensis TaxID=2923272 RepID=A0ABY3XXG1_9ACTN|nr:hypothetical protein [Streptomyces tubbatahanensis]UNS98918.1 hypothetical protein MMF93_22495 [Streptomyces tubbatahanensis]